MKSIVSVSSRPLARALRQIAGDASDWSFSWVAVEFSGAALRSVDGGVIHPDLASIGLVSSNESDTFPELALNT
ncbi:MAG: hypothetical protein ABIR16_02855, partial [Dokdonella sp.]